MKVLKIKKEWESEKDNLKAIWLSKGMPSFDGSNCINFSLYLPLVTWLNNDILRTKHILGRNSIVVNYNILRSDINKTGQEILLWKTLWNDFA